MSTADTPDAARNVVTCEFVGKGRVVFQKKKRENIAAAVSSSRIFPRHFSSPRCWSRVCNEGTPTSFFPVALPPSLANFNGVTFLCRIKRKRYLSVTVLVDMLTGFCAVDEIKHVICR
ncbi:unnamed protein product, partial [Ixodes pacificus]